MKLRNQLLTLMACLPLFIGSPVSAQVCGRKNTSGQSTTTSGLKEQDTSNVQQQKPSAVRDLAPRNLPSVNESEAERARDAAKVLSDLPKALADQAKAVAVIPGVKKAAFMFGGRWGKGLISARDENGDWIPPAFIEIGGGSFGLQLGIESADLVLVFSDAEAVKSLLRGKLTLSGTAAAAAGPMGRNLEAGADILMSSGILSYSHSKGIFVGISLEGAALSIDDSSNHKVYGKYINGDEILVDRRVETNEVVAPFLTALDRYAPAERNTKKNCCTTN